MADEAIISVFQQDLSAFSAAVKSKDFRESNIFANRIMSNAFLTETQDFGIVGFILKELSNDGMLLQQSKNDTSFSDFIKTAQKFVSEIIVICKNNTVDLNKIWTLYGEMLIRNRDIFMSKNEVISYKRNNSKFSKKIIHKLLKVLETNKKILAYPSNNFFKGMLNELSRLIKNHSIDSSDAHFISLIIMMERIDQYVKNTSVVNEFPDRAKNEILPLTDKIIKLYNSITEKDDKSSEIDTLLWELIGIWRLYFIEFMELGTQIAVREERSVDDPIKNKLVDAIAKEIEKEVGSE